jgi:hypothetical protein
MISPISRRLNRNKISSGTEEAANAGMIGGIDTWKSVRGDDDNMALSSMGGM